MNKKRLILIVLAVLFALVLAADLALQPASPASTQPPRDFAADSGNLARLPGDSSGMPLPPNASGNAFTRYRIPIGAVSALGFVLFLILAIRAGKKQPVPEAPENSMPPLELDSDTPPRAGNRGYWVAGICLILAIAMIVASLPTAATDSVSVNSRILSGTSQLNTISTVLTGTGTLTAPEAQAVSIPEILELDAYHVKNGDRVSSGDILASVSKAQVNSAISELQSVIQELDGDLSEAKNAVPSSSIKSTTSGRVKKIYAEKEDSVARTVYENGALMLISLDGFMSLQVEQPLSIGTDVTVTLSDGTQEPGKVISFSDSLSTITISDAKAACDEEVTVTGENGEDYGSGTLSIHSPLKVVGYYGTVSGVSVSLNQKVSNGTVLFTLKDTGHTEKYSTLLERRKELEDQMDALVRLSQDGFVRAETEGVVTGIPDGAEYRSLEPSVSKTISREPLRVSLLANYSESLRPILLNEEAPVDPPEGDSGEGGGDGGETPEETEPPKYTFQVAMVMKRMDPNNLIVSVISTQEVQEGASFDHLAGDPSKGTMMPLINAGQPVRFCDGSSWVGSTFGSICEGDILLINDEVGLVFQRSSSSMQMPEMSLGDLMGGMGGFGGMTVVRTPAYETYNSEQRDILSITPQNEFTAEIQIDELDILSLTPGMDAAITLDALPGQSLEGRITHINYYGSNEGGNTKYTVEVTLPRIRSMLEGMNASVKFVTAVSDPVPTVPAAALQEINGKTWLYTAYDSKTGELSGLVEVETGISDGENVQILSGLDEGTTFYYRYADALEYRFL